MKVILLTVLLFLTGCSLLVVGTSDAELQSHIMVYSAIQEQIRKQVDLQYPNLPEMNKEDLVREQTEQMINSQTESYCSQVKVFAEQLEDGAFEVDESKVEDALKRAELCLISK